MAIFGDGALANKGEKDAKDLAKEGPNAPVRYSSVQKDFNGNPTTKEQEKLWARVAELEKNLDVLTNAHNLLAEQHRLLREKLGEK